ncbi:cytochrome P450 [Thozetella sp. PMI_491]|nr:cytochrome P450 [Thozetella sp. PMI_491]
MSAFATFFAWAGYSLGSVIAIVIIYRLSYDPLRKFPGPSVAWLTDGYAGFHALRKRLHLATYRDHVRYGPVVRQGPNRLVFNTMTALHDIYLNPRVTKSRIYLQSLLSTKRPSMFNALDKTVHSKKRRLNSYRLNVYMAWPAISFVDPALRWLGRKEIPKFYGVLRNMIAARMSLPRDAANDLYAVASGDITPSGEKGLQGTDLWSEASFFVMAGGTTVSTLLSAIFFYLTRHPDVYMHLALEIRSTFPSSQSITNGPELSSCKYLRAVIDETLRVAPPTTATLWREEDVYSTSVTPSNEPFVVDGNVIPRGTAVGVSLYSVLHNEAYFPDPFAFRPERWLAVEDQHDDSALRKGQATMRSAFAPFILGDRACAGKAMAYLETSLTVAKTLWYFDFEAAPGELGMAGGGIPGGTGGRDKVDEYQLYDIFTADHSGPNLIFRRRGDYWKELEAQGAVSFKG